MLTEDWRYMSINDLQSRKQFNLSNLKGISDETLEMHFKLYEGYVKETNNLNERIAEFIKDGKVDQEELPAYSELTRRLGFEYNGMVLHEYYFDNLKSGGGTGDPTGTVDVSAKRRKRALAATTSGKRTLSASARCAASAGPSVIRTPRTAGFRITGSRCMRRATSPASIRFW